MEIFIAIAGFFVFVGLYAGGVYLRQELAPNPQLTPRDHMLYGLLGFLGVMALMFPIISIALTGGHGWALLSIAVLTVEQGFVIPERLSRMF